VREFEYLKEKLREKGYKLTPQRRSILDIILDNEGKHLSAEDVYELVKGLCPEIGLALRREKNLLTSCQTPRSQY
jgi:Fur family ferric uptake transcriptional regulator